MINNQKISCYSSSLRSPQQVIRTIKMTDNSKVDENLDDLRRRTFVNKFRTDYIVERGVVLPENYRNIADEIENFEVRDSDVWICTFPKTGTTWTQEMIWCIANDLDFEGAKVDLMERFPFLEMSGLADFTSMTNHHQKTPFQDALTDSPRFIDKLPSPRFIKTHLPFQLLPRQLREGITKAKIVYVTRNVKDTCISYFHHCQLLEFYTGSFEEFCRLLMGDKLTDAPFWRHINSYVEQKNKLGDQILFLKFEDMKADLRSAINKMSDFLVKPRLSSELMERLVDHLSFKKMKENPAVNMKAHAENSRTAFGHNITGEFYRSGETQQWKTAMTSEINNEFDKWIKENLKEFPGLSNYILAS